MPCGLKTLQASPLSRIKLESIGHGQTREELVMPPQPFGAEYEHIAQECEVIKMLPFWSGSRRELCAPSKVAEPPSASMPMGKFEPLEEL